MMTPGKAHIEWPFRKDEPQPDDNATPPVSQDDVNIDYVDNGYAPHLQELHAQMLPGNALRQAPETVLADLTEDAFAVEVKRVNGLHHLCHRGGYSAGGGGGAVRHHGQPDGAAGG